MSDRSEAIERAAREGLAVVEWFQRFAITMQHNELAKTEQSEELRKRREGYAASYCEAAKKCQAVIDALESALALPSGPDLAAENERLRTALAFYVDPDNHVLVNYDRGDIARAALEGTK